MILEQLGFKPKPIVDPSQRDAYGQPARIAGTTSCHFFCDRMLAEAGVPLKRTQEILGHASERTTLAIYHSMSHQHDDAADRIAQLAGLAHLGNM